MRFLTSREGVLCAALLALPVMLMVQPRLAQQMAASGQDNPGQRNYDGSQAQTAPADQQPVPQPHNPPVIGTINYVEGQATIGNEPLSATSAGNVVLQENESVTTNAGKVEVLLTPGVFLRVGDNSTAKMVSPSLSATEVALENGQATLEVADIHRENDITVDLPAGQTRILKKGFYEFDAGQNVARVFKGEARVSANGKDISIKDEHEFAFNEPQLKSRGFHKEDFDTSDLYRWSSLRSSYIAEANVDAASRYVNSGAFTPGWYWDPWFGVYTWIPGDGVFYTPFGWGFYSPYYVYDAPFFFYGYYGGPYRRHFDRDFHAWGPGPHYGPHPLWHGDGRIPGGHTYRGFGGGMHDNHGFGAHGGAQFHGGGGFRGGGGRH